MADAAGRSYAAFYANLKAQLGDKSASDLLDELDSKLEGEGGLSDEEIKAYMDLITELEPEPENPAFEAFTQDYIDRGRRSVPESEPAESGSRSPGSFPRYFGILVAVFAVFAAMMMFAYGEQAKNTAVNIIGDIMKTGPGESGKMVLDQAGENGFTSLEEALAAYGVEDIAPHWIPEEFVVDCINNYEIAVYAEVSSEYLSDNGKYLVFRFMIYNGKLPEVNYEIIEGTRFIYKRNGQEYILVENNGQYRAFWENGNCYCNIAGDIGKDEIKQIINSIQEGQ